MLSTGPLPNTLYNLRLIFLEFETPNCLIFISVKASTSLLLTTVTRPSNLVPSGTSQPDNKTSLKGYQVWFDGNLVFDYGVICEERLARIVYQHLGNHSRILTCFGLEEVAPGSHSLRLEMTPLGCVRAYIQKNANNPPPIQYRLQMAFDVAIGLSYVHLRGAMLCNLSCTNLFVFDKLCVKLSDFGGALLKGFDFKFDQTHESRCHLPSRGREYDNVLPIKRERFSLGSAIYEISV